MFIDAKVTPASALRVASLRLNGQRPVKRGSCIADRSAREAGTVLPARQLTHAMIALSSLAECSGTNSQTPTAIAIIKAGMHRNASAKRARRLLQRNGDEGPQHKADKIGDRPYDAIGGTADARREHLGGQGRARSPYAEQPEAPGQTQHPQQYTAVGVNPEGHKNGTLDQHRDKGEPAADPVGEPAG